MQPKSTRKYWCRTDSPEYLERLAERFWLKVDRKGPNDCWPWLGSRLAIKPGQVAAYGQVKVRDKNVLAHRVALSLSGTVIPDDLDVLHTCDNPSCCNPAHLYCGDHTANMQDKVRRGRSPDFRGERCPTSILTTAQVLAIREAWSAPDRPTEAVLGARFGVSRYAISDIVCGKSWKHLLHQVVSGGPAEPE